MMIHALRTMVYDFARDFDFDPFNDYIDEKAAICKLFSIDTVRLVSMRCSRSSVVTVTSRIPRMARPSVCIVTAALCGSRKGAPTVQRITIARECERHGGKIAYLFDDHFSVVG